MLFSQYKAMALAIGHLMNEYNADIEYAGPSDGWYPDSTAEEHSCTIVFTTEYTQTHETVDLYYRERQEVLVQMTNAEDGHCEEAFVSDGTGLIIWLDEQMKRVEGFK